MTRSVLGLVVVVVLLGTTAGVAALLALRPGGVDAHSTSASASMPGNRGADTEPAADLGDDLDGAGPIRRRVARPAADPDAKDARDVREAQAAARAQAESDLAAVRLAQQRLAARAPDAGLRSRLVVEPQQAGDHSERGWMIDGRRDGLWTKSFASGVRIETEYEGGERNGREAAWHAHGAPRYVCSYVDGKQHGVSTAWHENGHVLSTQTYANGVLEGWARTFHSSGALAEESLYVGGRETGVNRGWHASGALAWQIEYREGRRNGSATWFHDDGTLRAVGTYADGSLNGEYVEYLPGGDVARSEMWEGGRLRVAEGRPGDVR